MASPPKPTPDDREFPRGFLDVLTPDENPVSCLDPIGPAIPNPNRADVQFNNPYIEFFFEHDAIRCSIDILKIFGEELKIIPWKFKNMDDIISCMSEFFIYYVYGNWRPWEIFSFEIIHLDGQVYEYKIPRKLFESYILSGSDSEGPVTFNGDPQVPFAYTDIVLPSREGNVECVSTKLKMLKDASYSGTYVAKRRGFNKRKYVAIRITNYFIYLRGAFKIRPTPVRIAKILGSNLQRSPNSDSDQKPILETSGLEWRGGGSDEDIKENKKTAVREAEQNLFRERLHIALCLSLADAGFFSLSACTGEGCEATLWPVFRRNSRVKTLSQSLCPRCLHRRRRAQKNLSRRNSLQAPRDNHEIH